MLNLINKETRQIPGWPVVQGRGVDRVRSTQPPPRGWETLLVISRCLASLSHPLWHSPSQSSLSKAARYVHHIRTRQSRIMIDVRRINRTRALAVATRSSNASRLSLPRETHFSSVSKFMSTRRVVSADSARFGMEFSILDRFLSSF